MANSGRSGLESGVLIDFTAPAATRGLIAECGAAGDCDGHRDDGPDGEEQETLIDKASRRIAILQATNMSLGVNVFVGPGKPGGAAARGGLRHRDRRVPPQSEEGCSLGDGGLSLAESI